MKLSIITINYNDHKGLKITLEQIAQLKYSDFELIVIDGGSTDGSLEIIQQYAAHIDYWVSEPDHGIYHAMNKGVAVAQGEYCIFMNAGDFFYDTEVLNRHLPTLPDVDFAVGDTLLFTWKDGKIDPGKRISSPVEVDLHTALYEDFGHQATFTRTRLLKAKGYDEQLKIVSDWKFLVEHLIFSNSSYHRIDDLISYNEAGGISSTSICWDERLAVRKQLLDQIPPRVLQTITNQSQLLEKYDLIIKYSKGRKFRFKTIRSFTKRLNKLLTIFGK